MKSKLLLFIMLFISLQISAQTIVGTEIENRNVLFEEYTGIACGFCPMGHLEIANFLANHPEDGFCLAMHQGAFAIPTPGQPDYNTESGDAWGDYFQVFGWPTALISRHDYGAGLLYPLNEWQQYANQVIDQEAWVNVACEASVDVQTRELSIHVEAYYTGNSPESENFLTVALAQNNIKGPQFSSWFNPDAITPDGAYIHQHILRDLITDLWGEEISPTSHGTFIDKTYTYTVPVAIKDVPVRLGDISIISFISETQLEVETVSGTHPELINFAYSLDAGIDELFVPESSCGFVESKVVVANYGSEVISSVTFEVTIGDEAPVEFTWNEGTIAPFASYEIYIPAAFYANIGTNDYLISITSINGATDENAANNDAQASIAEAVEVSLPVTLNLTTDNYFGTAWYLYDGQNNLVQQGSGYAYEQTFVIPLEVDAGCYKLEMTDLDGFFFGSYSLTDGDNNTFFSRIGNFGNSDIISFTLPTYEPTAIIGASTQVACIGGTIQFLDASTGGADSWEWTFEGGDPVSSNEKNPLVSYAQPGSYDVSLAITNSFGTDQVTMEDYITITSLSYGNLALDFDGLNDYVEVTNESAFDFTNEITLEAWMKPESVSGMMGLMSKNYGNNAHPYQIRIVDDEVLFGFYSNTIGWQPTQTTSTNLQAGEWVHIACTYNQQNVKIYVNGEQKANGFKSFEIPQNDQPFEIGRTKDVSYEYFDGIIEEVRVWDVALSQETIADNMCHNYYGSTDEHLIGYYKFNECGGTLLTDMQNTNNGILMNMEGDEWLESDACPVYTVNFQITDESNASPIQGATVNMNGTIRYTDENGLADFVGYEPGSYDYVVLMEGANATSGTFELVDEDVTIELSLLVTNIFDPLTSGTRIYPNPATGQLNILVPCACKMELLDMCGKSQIEMPLEAGNTIVKLSNCTAGIYFLKLVQEHEVHIEKIIIQ